MQVVIRDWTQTCSDQDLRMMYSMVFIRFVNGYVDAFQSSRSAKSIAYLAVEKVGMPIWFVELRHTATHDYLPSLTILRSATNQALAWINDNYWIPQLVSVRLDETLTPDMKQAMSEDVLHMLENHRSEKERQIDGQYSITVTIDHRVNITATTPKLTETKIPVLLDHCVENTLPQPKQDALVVSRLARDLIKRCRSGDELLDTVVPILLEPGMLVPRSKKMRASVRDLTLSNSGRLVDLCWMPLLNRLHTDLKGTSRSTDGEPLSFWARLLNEMLEKLIEANKSSSQATATTEKSAAKVGSYLITILAWIKHLIKLHYEQSSIARARSTSAQNRSTATPTVSSSPALAVPSPTNNSSSPIPATSSRQSVAAMASQIVAEHAATSQTSSTMFDQDDIINVVEDCLVNSQTHVSPLIRSVLNTVIECDADVKEKIGPILRQIDQRIVAGTSSSISTPEAVSVGGGAWQEGPRFDPDLQADTDSHMASAKDPVSGFVEGSTKGAAEDTNMVDGDGQEDDLSRQTGQPVEDGISLKAGPESWALFSVDDWRPCPMGCLPGGILPDLSLPWDLDAPPIARIPV
ncbi:rRNA-processing protein las1 [Mortierella alpina]|nr:rRNA-processing protein las1 [Mortierella alpina]